MLRVIKQLKIYYLLDYKNIHEFFASILNQLILYSFAIQQAKNFATQKTLSSRYVY